MLYLKGHAREWYPSLYADAINVGTKVPCRQGLGLELASPLHVEIPPADSDLEALVMAMTQRRNPAHQRAVFSVAHGIQKFLGLPESYLCDKFPILNRYIRSDEEVTGSRISGYMREMLPEYITKNSPWIQTVQTNNGPLSSIDQLHHALALLKDSDGKNSRRAFIDFGEGYKPRCVSSWHFIIRDSALTMFQHMRSNDILVGLPNDLASARISQIILAKMIGVNVGTLHHHASIVQLYSPDCAGIDGTEQFSKIDFEYFSENRIRSLLRGSRFIESFFRYINNINVTTLSSQDALVAVRHELSKILKHHIEGDGDISSL